MISFDVVILGAGPSGLAAAYRLAREGAKVALVEHSSFTGGLMRGIRRGSFFFDLGRKELSLRFPQVQAFWTELLDDCFCVYPHHVGILYSQQIFEKSSHTQGKMRGMSYAQMIELIGSFFWSQVGFGSRLATSLEDYFLLRYGQKYYEYFAYGFTRKFGGKSPHSMPAPYGEQFIPRFSLVRDWLTSWGNFSNLSSTHEQEVWRHPVRGTGLIAARCEEGARSAGATVMLNTKVISIGVHRGSVRSVNIYSNGSETNIEAGNIISSLPLPLLLLLLRPSPPRELTSVPEEEAAFRRSTVLVYLMAEGEPRFPHNWLEVNDPELRVGRIVNYGTWNAFMVPRGKTGLCLEYFCVDGDNLLGLSNENFITLGLSEVARAGLIDPNRVFDTFVVRLPHANASTVSDDWREPWMVRALDYIYNIRNLYETNRPGVDRATLAGLDAAAACRVGKPMSLRSLEPSSITALT
jgi:protoporphyrinogen oxidase